jgi:hypothetical protein
MDSSSALVSILLQTKELFEHEHAYLSPPEIAQLWEQKWSNINSLVGSGLPASLPNSLPQKRLAPAMLSTTSGIQQGPPPKRSQTVGSGSVLSSWSFGLTGPP